MARFTNDGQMRVSTTSPLMSQTSHLRDIRQTGCDVMSVLVSQEADVLLANLAYGHDSPYHDHRHYMLPDAATKHGMSAMMMVKTSPMLAPAHVPSIMVVTDIDLHGGEVDDL